MNNSSNILVSEIQINDSLKYKILDIHPCD